MKKLYFLNETEKERILNLYENKGNNKNILNEEEKATRTTGLLFASGYDIDTAYCLGNHQPDMVAKGNYGSVIATDGKFLYYKDMKYSTQADYEKWFNGLIEGDMPPISGTYACTKRSLGGETKRTLKRTEAPKLPTPAAEKMQVYTGQAAKDQMIKSAADAGFKEGSDSNWKNTICAKKYGTPMTNPNYPGKETISADKREDISIFDGFIDGLWEVFLFNTGAFYVTTTPYPTYKRMPSDETQFYRYTCSGDKVIPTKQIVNIDGKPIGGTSVTTNPAANQNYYTNKLANVGQKLGVQTSGQLTPDMLNKLMDKLGGTGSTPKEPTSITI